MGDFVGLILFGQRVQRSGIAKPGWGWFLRDAFQERWERTAGRTADPSASLGMTRGEGWLRWELLVDAKRTAGPSTALRFGRDDNSVAAGTDATEQCLTPDTKASEPDSRVFILLGGP